MKKVIIPIILIILAVLIVSGAYLNLRTFDMVDGQVIHYDSQPTDPVIWYGPVPQGFKHYCFGNLVKDTINPTGELVKDLNIVSSWSSDGMSMSISINPGSYSVGCDKVFPLVGPNPHTTKWWYELTFYDGGTGQKTVLADESGLRDSPSMITDVQFLTFGFNDWVGSWTGYEFMPVSSDVFILPCEHSDGWYVGDVVETIDNDDDPEEWLDAISKPVTFKLLGPVDGILKVELKTKLFWWDTPDAKKTYHCNEVAWITDWVQISRGECAISIDPSPDAYRPTIFEEGETVSINIQTDYAGNTVSSVGQWRVTIYNPDGIAMGDPGDDIIDDDDIELIHPDGSKTDGLFYVDDLAGGGVGGFQWYTVKWIIPNDISLDYTKKDWEIKIENTIQAKKTDDFIITVLGGRDDGPLNPFVEITNKDSEDYTKHVECLAEGNPDGTGEVSYFTLQATSNGIKFFEQTWTAHSSYSTNAYTASGDIPITNGVIRVFMRAYDKNNMPSARVEDSFNHDPDGTLGCLVDIYTKYGDDTPIPGVTITLNDDVSETYSTDGQGHVEIIVPKGNRVKICAEHDGDVICANPRITTNGQVVNLYFGFSTMMIISIAIGIIIMSLCIIAFIMLHISIPWKILIMFIGGIVSLFIYIILNGYLYL